MKYILLFVLVCIFISGCYTRKKAEHQVNLAAVTFPDILAKKARDLFPCVTKGGDTIWVSDSAAYNEVLKDLMNDNKFMSDQHDSLLKQIYNLQKDTACYEIVELYVDIIGKMKTDYSKLEERFKHIPPITITKTIHDTTVDNAAVKACDFDKSKLIVLLEDKTKYGDKWHKRANRFMWILIAIGAVIGVFTYIRLKTAFAKK